MDEFDETRVSTKIAASLHKVIETPNATFKLNIWDTMGQEKYNALTPFYYRGRPPSPDADIVIIVFDKSDKKSFDRVKELTNAVLSSCTKKPRRPALPSDLHQHE